MLVAMLLSLPVITCCFWSDRLIFYRFCFVRKSSIIEHRFDFSTMTTISEIMVKLGDHTIFVAVCVLLSSSPSHWVLNHTAWISVINMLSWLPSPGTIYRPIYEREDEQLCEVHIDCPDRKLDLSPQIHC